MKSFLEYLAITALAILLGFSAIQLIGDSAKDIVDKTASKIVEIGK